MTNPPIVWSATSVATIGSGLLTAVSTALISTLGGRVNRVAFYPGQDAPWDECDCGLLALTVRRRYRSLGFPGDATDRPFGNCDELMLVFDCALAVVRCVPTPDVNGRTPSPAAMLKAESVLESDAYTLWNATYCYLTQLRDTAPQLVADFIINDDSSLGPSGACAGSELHFKFAQYVPCGCG